jgi:transcriptional antiterminator RfaH
MGKAAKRKMEDRGASAEVQAGPAWYVVIAHAGRERQARDHLERQAYEVYLPMRLHKAKAGELSARPFFPRYMFVRIDLTVQPWRPILSTLGVQSMLMSGDHPMWIAEKLVRRIQAHEVGGFIKVSERPRITCPFTQGQKLKVLSGPFEKLEAVFAEPVDANRVAILVSLLGRDSRVVLHMDQLAT